MVLLKNNENGLIIPHQIYSEINGLKPTGKF